MNKLVSIKWLANQFNFSKRHMRRLVVQHKVPKVIIKGKFFFRESDANLAGFNRKVVKWTKSEDKYLQDALRKGIAYNRISILGRTKIGIRDRIRRLKNANSGSSGNLSNI